MAEKSPRFRIADSVYQYWLIHDYSEAEYGSPVELVDSLLALKPGEDAILESPVAGGRHALAARVCGYGWRMVGIRNADGDWEVVHLLVRV